MTKRPKSSGTTELTFRSHDGLSLRLVKNTALWTTTAGVCCRHDHPPLRITGRKEWGKSLFSLAKKKSLSCTCAVESICWMISTPQITIGPINSQRLLCKWCINGPAMPIAAEIKRQNMYTNWSLSITWWCVFVDVLGMTGVNRESWLTVPKYKHTLW